MSLLTFKHLNRVVGPRKLARAWNNLQVVICVTSGSVTLPGNLPTYLHHHRKLAHIIRFEIGPRLSMKYLLYSSLVHYQPGVFRGTRKGSLSLSPSQWSWISVGAPTAALSSTFMALASRLLARSSLWRSPDESSQERRLMTVRVGISETTASVYG